MYIHTYNNVHIFMDLHNYCFMNLEFSFCMIKLTLCTVHMLNKNTLGVKASTRPRRSSIVNESATKSSDITRSLANYLSSRQEF